MTRDEALAIIEEEHLTGGIWFESPHNHSNSVAVHVHGDGFRVLNTDERAVQGAVREFDNESDALDLFIHRLRLSNEPKG